MELTAKLNIVFAYVLIINDIVFFVYGIDKYKAKKGRWRISEAALLLLALLGGALGAWCGMVVFRHKTHHLKFRILVPAIFLLWIVGLAVALYKFAIC